MNLQYCIYHLLNHAAKASRHMMESDSKALCNSRVPFLCLLIQIRNSEWLPSLTGYEPAGNYSIEVHIPPAEKPEDNVSYISYR